METPSGTTTSATGSAAVPLTKGVLDDRECLFDLLVPTSALSSEPPPGNAVVCGYDGRCAHLSPELVQG